MSVNGSNIRKLRQAVGIGQAQLAKRVGVSQGMISQLELSCRSCRPDTLEKLAAELRCTVDDLSGKPAVWVSFMRNCRRLSEAQLCAVNAVVLLIVGSPADIKEAASTSTNSSSHEITSACSLARFCSECEHIYNSLSCRANRQIARNFRR